MRPSTPESLGSVPSVQQLGVRRCNHTREGSSVATARENARRRAEKGVSGRASKEGRRSVGPSEGAGLRKATMRSERCAAGFQTSLGCCMRCAQSAAGEPPPNPKVHHVHYDTPSKYGQPPGVRLLRGVGQKRPVFQSSQNIAHPGRTENGTPGPMSVFPRQFNQRSYLREVEYVRGVKNVHARRPHRGPSPKQIAVRGRIKPCKR
jgi:hypothetical protein